jgi:tetratricopeptide (TPR) repeat protein
MVDRRIDLDRCVMNVEPKRAAVGWLAVAAAVAAGACASEAAYIEQGQSLVAQRKYDQAIEQFMAALEENPDSAQAHLNLGLVYLAMRRYAEASKAIEQSRSIDDSENAIVALAMVFYQQKQYAEAAAMMEEALRRSPDRADHHLRLGIIRRQAGDLERAAESLQMAITQDPRLVEARIQLGLSLRDLKRYQEALDVLKDAVRDMRESDEAVAEVQTALGEVYEAMELTDYAEHSFKLAVKNDATYGPAIAGLGRMMRKNGDIEAAIEMLAQAATRKVPKDPRVHLELGLAYKEYRLEPKAIGALTEAIRLDPRQLEAYSPLLELLDKRKASAEETFKVLAKAAKVMPDDVEIQIRFGTAAYARKQFQPAIDTFKHVITDLEPAHIEANFQLGLSQVGAGQLDEATQTANALQYLDPDKATELMQAIQAGPAGDDDEEDGKKKKRKKRKRKRKKRKR